MSNASGAKNTGLRLSIISVKAKNLGILTERRRGANQDTWGLSQGVFHYNLGIL